MVRSGSLRLARCDGVPHGRQFSIDPAATLCLTDSQHAELYSREAEQEHLARDGMKAVIKLVSGSKKQGG